MQQWNLVQNESMDDTFLLKKFFFIIYLFELCFTELSLIECEKELLEGFTRKMQENVLDAYLLWV